ncbi:MAG: hypothetical protein AB1627_01165 [Chloroflexota bacterium]
MTNPETAVTVIEPTAALQVNLDAWPTERFNRLLPMQTLGLATDLIKPIVQAVQLTPADGEGYSPDHYASPDIPQGRRALTARSLNKLASTAGIDFTEEVRLDDGRDPLICGVRWRAEMLLPTGRRITTTGTKWVDMRRMSWKGGLDSAQAMKFRAMLYEHTSTRARNRAVRAILSLQSSYSIAELQKPFAVVSFVPNMDHPDIRGRILDAMAPAIAATYGPTAPRLAAGGDVTVVDEAPDEDEPTQTPRALAPGAPVAAATDSGTADPGSQRGSEAAGEPDWITGGAPKPATPALAGLVAARLRDEGQPKGPVNENQKARLRDLFAPLGEARGALFVAGLAALDMSAEGLTCAQARAIEMSATELGDEPFRAAWQELAGGAS